jgi:tRNA A37 threonylcarbamoyladenosine dehydratase
MVRKRLGRRKASADFLCVYSEEAPLDPATETLCGTGHCACSQAHPKTDEADAENPDWCARKTRINGTAVHITAVFGFMLAGLVIQDVVARSPLPPPAAH